MKKATNGWKKNYDHHQQNGIRTLTWSLGCSAITILENNRPDFVFYVAAFSFFICRLYERETHLSIIELIIRI